MTQTTHTQNLSPMQGAFSGSLRVTSEIKLNIISIDEKGYNIFKAATVIVAAFFMLFLVGFQSNYSKRVGKSVQAV